MIKKFNKIKYIYLVIKIFLLFFLLFSPKINAKSKEMIRLMDLFENVFEKTHEEYVDNLMIMNCQIYSWDFLNKPYCKENG